MEHLAGEQLTPLENEIRSLRSYYRSGNDDLRTDFFEPCLKDCKRYRRAVGYFFSSALVTWASALPRLVDFDGVCVQLLIAPNLTDQDRDAIRGATGAEQRQAVQQRLGDRIVESAMRFAEHPEDVTLRLRLMAWMIATERLELRFAYPNHVDSPGIFHEKIGVFDFPSGDSVAFTGSANESGPGHNSNYETIDVYRSWIDGDKERVQIKSEQFDEAWSGDAEGLDSVPLSTTSLANIRSMAPEHCPLKPPCPTPNPEPTSDNRWRHQDEAIDAFLEAECGVLEMATGTGKTRTALRICQHLLDEGAIDTIIIAADGTDLLDQWYQQLLHLGQRRVPRLSVVRHYGTHHDREQFVLQPTNTILLTSREALPPALRGLPTTTSQKTILIHDEVHRLGSTGNRNHLAALSDPIRFRLGLSATPEREYDEDGNDFIEKHIGSVIFQFDLADAIRRRILSPFDYHPIEYVPNQDDRDRIQAVFSQQSTRARNGNPMTQEEVWIKIAHVHKTSHAKIPLFDSFIENNQRLLTRCIIFVETRQYGEVVLDHVHRYRHDFHTYYMGEGPQTLQDFAQGTIECLITCHRLSEGIDIHSVSTVILFSSARSRLETIQRMGRCLRMDPNNPDKRAHVVDFIRPAGDGPHNSSPDIERREWLSQLSQLRYEDSTT